MELLLAIAVLFLLVSEGLVLSCCGIWWYLLCGPVVVNLGTGEGDTLILASPEPAALVEVEPGDIEVLVDEDPGVLVDVDPDFTEDIEVLADEDPDVIVDGDTD